MLIRLLVVSCIIAGVIARLGMLWDGRMDAVPTATLERETLLQQIADGQVDAVAFCFSSDAPVLLGFGVDGAPGRLGVDDNVDGVIDDRRETGAVGSDDRCLAPADPGYDGLRADPNAIVISRGTFEVCENDNASGGMRESAGNPEAGRWLTRRLGWVVGR